MLKSQTMPGMPGILSIRQIFLALFYISIAAFTCAKHRLRAECCGKVDAGAAFIHVDVLESGHTIKEINMPAIKADGFLVVWKGICLKPTVLYANRVDSEILSAGIGLGQYLPVGDKCSVTPSIGCMCTQFKTTLHYSPVPEFTLRLKEKFYSVSPYLGLDGSYCFLKGWRLIASYQYVWSRTYTTIEGFNRTKSHPKGSNYALVLERDLTETWSVSLGAAYNSSLTKEKHGLRGYGMRIAFAYWF